MASETTHTQTQTQTQSGSGISWEYASLHLAKDRQPRRHPTNQFFTGQMLFLLPNQQCQSSESIKSNQSNMTLITADIPRPGYNLVNRVQFK